jgi:two-component system, cell cycle sensor histidine kinase and response regulator CckA
MVSDVLLQRRIEELERKLIDAERVIRDLSPPTVAPATSHDVAFSAEEALRRSDALFRAVIEKSAEIISLTAADGTTRYLTPSAWRLLGWTPQEMGTRTLRDQVVPEDQARITSELSRLVRTGERDMSMEIRAYHRDGSIVWVESTATNLLDDPNVRAIVGNYRDITARKRSEEALRESELRYRRIVDNTSEGVWTYDASGNTTFMNPRMAEMLGCSAQWAIGQPIYAFVEEGLRAEAQARVAARKKGVAVLAEFQLKRRDGSDLWVSVRSDSLLDDDGNYESSLALMTDITERREAEAALHRSEEQLRQAQKLEALGRLAGGIAHDFNNVLSVILSYSAMLAADLAPGDPVRGDLEEISKAGHRAAGLTRQLLMFSRQEVAEPRVLDLNDLLANMDKMLQRILGEDVVLVSARAPAVGRIRADPGHVEQIVMNLVVNARDAMPTGGKITIETANVFLDETYARDHLGVTPGPYVRLTVTDTGTGMDPATQARIFEPFFTTKEKGKGTGLGLSTVFGIVQQCKGAIWVHSEPGHGTTFKVHLPRVDAKADRVTPSAAPISVRASETILLVEDEDQIRVVAREILRKQGYRVLEARNAGEALLHCESYDGTIHLLLTDVVMPQMSGPELAKRLIRIRPTVKVLCMSGYTDDAVVRHGALAGGMAYLQKPITPDNLTQKVRAVLDAQGPGNVPPTTESS